MPLLCTRQCTPWPGHVLEPRVRGRSMFRRERSPRTVAASYGSHFQTVLCCSLCHCQSLFRPGFHAARMRAWRSASRGRGSCIACGVWCEARFAQRRDLLACRRAVSIKLVHAAGDRAIFIVEDADGTRQFALRSVYDLTHSAKCSHHLPARRLLTSPKTVAYC